MAPKKILLQIKVIDFNALYPFDPPDDSSCLGYYGGEAGEGWSFI